MARLVNSLRNALGLGRRNEAAKLDVDTFVTNFRRSMEKELVPPGHVGQLTRMSMDTHARVLQQMPQQEKQLLQKSGLSAFNRAHVHNVKTHAKVSEADARAALERFAWTKAALQKSEELYNSGRRVPSSFDALIDELGDDERPPRVWGGQDESDKPITRNQPCPCGSGKRAKRCCHISTNALPRSAQSGAARPRVGIQ